MRDARPSADPGSRLVERTIAELASRQHGVVAREQLLAAGIAPGVVDHRLKLGWLHPVHRGVYRVGPVMAPRAEQMAACLACGRSAVVSGRSAAALWQMPVDRPSPAAIEISVPKGTRRRPGLRVRRIRSLRPDEITKLDGIPITTPARTLYDLASSVAARELERAVARALAGGLTKPVELRRLLAHHSGRPGSARLRAVLQDGNLAVTRSEAEERFLALVRKTPLDRPEVNVKVSGYEVDFFWRTERLVVEIDGFYFHSSRSAFERDRRRDATLAAAGLRVVRITWHQLANEPHGVLVRLAQALVLAARS